MVDGFAAYAPQLARGGAGFEPEYFPQLASLEDANFWFSARRELVLWALAKYGDRFTSFLEIGCGTGHVLQGVAARFPGVTVTGAEVFTAGLAFAAARVPAATFFQMDARRIPYEAEFDAVGAFDVLEHIAEDETVLAEVYRALKPDGRLFLSVPQHAWLWSPSDEYARHVRRYAARDLHRKVRAAGFEVLRSSSFVSLLMPMMLVSRWRSSRRADAFDASKELALPRVLNAILYRTMRAEIGLMKAGIDFPLGGSRLVVARKPL